MAWLMHHEAHGPRKDGRGARSDGLCDFRSDDCYDDGVGDGSDSEAAAMAKRPHREVVLQFVSLGAPPPCRSPLTSASSLGCDILGLARSTTGDDY
eukprot:7891894-Pyramimonas_sp.AAC.1